MYRKLSNITGAIHNAGLAPLSILVADGDGGHFLPPMFLPQTFPSEGHLNSMGPSVLQS